MPHHLQPGAAVSETRGACRLLTPPGRVACTSRGIPPRGSRSPRRGGRTAFGRLGGSDSPSDRDRSTVLVRSWTEWPQAASRRAAAAARRSAADDDCVDRMRRHRSIVSRAATHEPGAATADHPTRVGGTPPRPSSSCWHRARRVLSGHRVLIDRQRGRHTRRTCISSPCTRGCLRPDANGAIMGCLNRAGKRDGERPRLCSRP